MAQVNHPTTPKPIRNHQLTPHHPQKSLKSLAARNAKTLNRTHLITLTLHILYHTLRLLLFPHRKLLPYTLLTLPALAIELYFERLSRPTHTPSGDLQRAGEDLEAKGLMEWMWDVLYWTWGCVGLVVVVGDWGWWGWVVVPVYSGWAVFGTFAGLRKGVAGLGGSEEGQTSKRQAKIERRGGTRVQQYR